MKCRFNRTEKKKFILKFKSVEQQEISEQLLLSKMEIKIIIAKTHCHLILI